MSNKSSRKPRAKAPVPRQLPEIEADYGKFVAQAGQAQYQAHVYQQDLERINQQLINLNYEAAARKQLNAAAETVTPEVKNEGI